MVLRPNCSATTEKDGHCSKRSSIVRRFYTLGSNSAGLKLVCRWRRNTRCSGMPSVGRLARFRRSSISWRRCTSKHARSLQRLLRRVGAQQRCARAAPSRCNSARRQHPSVLFFIKREIQSLGKIEQINTILKPSFLCPQYVPCAGLLLWRWQRTAHIVVYFYEAKRNKNNLIPIAPRSDKRSEKKRERKPHRLYVP